MQFNPPPNPSLSSTHTAHHYSQPQTNQTPTPSPYHNFNPTSTIQHVIQSPQSLLPPKRKHALPSTSRPNPLPQHHSQNVPFLIYHDNPPPPFIFLNQNPLFIANSNFQPPVSYTYFFSDCAILYSIMSPKLLPEV